jgi:hypothetical protein
MCLMVRILYKFNTLEAFERAVDTVELHWGDKFIRGRVHYNKAKLHLTWQNLRHQLETAKTVNPATIHGLIAVEHQ